MASRTFVNVQRFNSDGSIDPSFRTPPQTASGQYSLLTATLALALQADGKVIIGGSFTTLGTAAEGNLARLNPDGGTDGDFNAGGTGADGPVYAIALQANGGIVIGGAFSSFNGTPLAGVARLTAAGVVDPQFNPGSRASTTGTVKSVAISPDDSVYLAGDFTQFNGLFGGASRRRRRSPPRRRRKGRRALPSLTRSPGPTSRRATPPRICRPGSASTRQAD